MGRLGSTPADGCAPLGEHLLGAWITFTEGLALAESRSAGPGAALTDSVTLTDIKRLGEILLGELLGVPNVAFAVGKGLGDGVVSGTALGRAWDAYLQQSDGLALADARAAAVGARGLADGVSLGDSLARAWAAYREQADGLTLSDSKLLGQLLLGELLGIPDVAFAVGKGLDDGVGLSDALARAWAAYLQQADGLALSDAEARAAGLALADAVALGDVEALLLALALTLRARSTALTLQGRDP